jgi:tetratricopeptide (TPR) repeat protein
MQRLPVDRFRDGIARAVAQLGGDRAAGEASGVSKSVWYDAKSGRAVPDDRVSWPAMRAVLVGIPAVVTGVRDWDELYRLVCVERRRRLPRLRDPRPAGPRPARPVPQQLPAGTVPFVARDAECRALDEALLSSGGGAVRMVVVAGPPGVGKTALAVDWAQRALGRFPDGVLYADLRGWGPDRPITAEEVLPAWLRSFGMDPAALQDDVASRATALRSVLVDRRVLLVLDNARDEEQVRPLLPGSASCAVLVTSRHDLQGLAIHHGARVMTLDPLSPAVAAGLLGEIVGAEIAGSAKILARLCGHLPLALRVVAESARGRSAAEIAALAEELDGVDRLDRLSNEDLRSDPRTVLSWSYRQLSVDGQDTLRLLGILPGRSFDNSAVAALTGTRPGQSAARLRLLTHAHLLRPEPGGRFAMHDLIRDYAVELAISEPRVDARARLLSYYLHTAQRADAFVTPLRYQLPLPGSSPAPAPFGDYDGALSWFETECPTLVALCEPAMDQPDGDEFDPLRWRIAFYLKGYLFLSKRTHEWLLSHQAALDAAIRIGDRLGEAMTRNNLGLAWHERGDDERALAQYEAAERLFAEVGDAHGVNNAIASQAVVHRRRGDLAEAQALNQRALRFYRRAAAHAPGSRRYVAITLRSIALVEIEARRYPKAERHLRESLQLCTELGMAMDLARAWNTLGAALTLSARFTEAAEAYEAAVTAGQDCGSRFEEAMARRGLGTVAMASGDRDRAERCWETALGLLTLLGSAKADEVRADLAALRNDQSS